MVDLRPRGLQQYIGDLRLDEDRREWLGVLDVPLLLLDGLAGLPTDKLPPLESLTSCDAAIAGGPCGDVSAIGNLRFFPRRETSDGRRTGRDQSCFSRVSSAACVYQRRLGAVGRQIETLGEADLMGIRDFVLMLGEYAGAAYLLRVNEVRDRAEVHPELISAARDPNGADACGPLAYRSLPASLDAVA